MPLRHLPHLCWILTIDGLYGEMEDWHTHDLDELLTEVVERWVAQPDRMPPVPWQHDTGCLVVECRVCGLTVGDGEHFADAEHAEEAAENDGWQGDVCPFCQPVPAPPN